MWKSPSSIRCRDSNPRPSDCESHPITTRPGLCFSLVIQHKNLFMTFGPGLPRLQHGAVINNEIILSVTSKTLRERVTVYIMNAILGQTLTWRLWLNQRDHMARLFLAICNRENLPNSVKNCQGMFRILLNTKETLKEIAQHFKDFAKVAEFCQIWSPWLQPRTNATKRFCFTLIHISTILMNLLGASLLI